MAITITVKKNSEEEKQEAIKTKNNEKYLHIFHTLYNLTIVDDINNNKWQEISPQACKVYITMIGITAMPNKELFNDPSIPFAIITTCSSIKAKACQKALDELLALGLIQEHSTGNPQLPPILANHAYRIIYNLPPDVLENGV